MFVSTAILILVLLSCLRIRKANERAAYLSKETCASVKGLFICYVFLRHAYPYLTRLGYSFPWWGDQLFLKFDERVGQLLVVMFLFYSGYGVADSVAKKGIDYIRKMPCHRILNTLLNFDVAIVFFIVVDLLVGTNIGLRQCLLSLIGWDSVGNSNWYIFAIVLCYIIFYLVFGIVRSNHMAAWIVAMAIGLCAVALSYLRPVWWYSTMTAFCAGIFYSVYRSLIEKLTEKFYWQILALVAVVFLLIPANQGLRHGVIYNIKSIAFASIVVLLTMRIKITGPVFVWFGNHLFPLYIYQRIPMIIMSAYAPSIVVSWGGGALHCSQRDSCGPDRLAISALGG